MYVGCADMSSHMIHVNASIQYHDLLTPELHAILNFHGALHNCIQTIVPCNHNVIANSLSILLPFGYNC